MKYYLHKIIFFTIAFLFLSNTSSQHFSYKKFKDEKKKIIIELPKTWYLKTLDDGKTVQMFISKELLLKTTDDFSTGVTITKIRRMSKSYTQISCDEDIVNVWLAAMIEAEKKYFKVEVVRTGGYASGNYSGKIREIKFQPDENMAIVHVYQLIVAHNDNLVSITFESPEKKWDIYNKAFKHGLMSLLIK